MIVKLIFIVLLASGLFGVSFLLSYEGFQAVPNLRAQHVPIDDVISNCEAMDSVIDSKGFTVEQIIRLINDNQINAHLNSNQVQIVEECLHGKLPQLSSYLTPQKIGFFEGIGIHEAKGQAKIIQIETDSYLRLETFEIDYESKNGKDFQMPELHVYLTTKSKMSPDVYLDKLKTKLGGKNYKLPDIDLNHYNTVLIYDEIKNEPYVKIQLTNPFYITDSINHMIDDSKVIDHPKIQSRAVDDGYGFFEGLNNFEAKGLATIEYEEDEGELKIQDFEISKGEDLRLYIN